MNTASGTEVKDTAIISKNETEPSKIEPLNDTKEEEVIKEGETAISKDETNASKIEPLDAEKEGEAVKEAEKIEEGKLEEPKIVEPEVIEIKKKISEISKPTVEEKILIDSQTTDVKAVALEIKPKKAVDLSAKEITIKEYILEKNVVPENKKELKLLRNEMALGKFVELDLPTGDIEWTIIKISYTDSEIADNNISEDSLRIIWYDEDLASDTFEEWVKLRKGDPEWVHGVGIDQVENYAWANVSHSSVYGMIGTIVGPPSTTELPTVTPEPTTTTPPTTTPAPTTAAPTTTPPPITLTPTTTPPEIIETVGPDEFATPVATPQETVVATQAEKGACGPTSVLALALIPLFLSGGKDEKR